MTQARSIRAMVFFTAIAALVGCELIVGNRTVEPRENGSDGGVDGGGGGGGDGVAEGSTCLLALDFGADGEEALGGVTTDASGHIWLAGTYRGKLSVGSREFPAPLASDTNMFLLALDGVTGEVLVSNTFDIGPVELGVAGIAITSGSVYVAGRFAGTRQLGTECPLKSAGNTDADAFVAHFDASGHCLAVKTFTNSPTDQVSGLAADNDRVIIAGTVNNGNALFVHRYNSMLAMQASSFFAAGHTGAIAPHVAALKDDQVLIAGDFVGTFDLSFSSSGITLDNGADKTPDAFTVAYRVSQLGESPSPAGPYLWSEDYGSPGNQTLVALAPGKSAGVSAFYAAGQFENTVDFHVGDQQPLKAVDGKDALVAAMDAKNGKILWSKRFGEDMNQSATAIAYDVLEQAVLVAGGFQGTIDLGSPPLTNPAISDRIFVARLSESGEPQWRRAFGADGVQSVSALLATKGEVTLAGAYTGTLDFGCKMPLVNKGTASRFFLARLKPELP